MARTNTLGNFLTDVASAIRKKKGTTDTILASNFDTEIESIETGGGSTVTKGIIINEFDENGYATDVSVVGMTSIPSYYFAADNDNTNRNALNKYVKNIQLPAGTTSIGIGAFQYCTNLALTELPAGITSIRVFTFYGCTNLALTELPSGVTSIETGAFNGCTNLALTELPSGITSMVNDAFNGCTNLALTELPSGVTSIKPRVFNGCTSLTEMTCLGNITTIETGAFNGCTKLSKFALPNITSVPTLSSTDAFRSTPIASGTGYIYVPDDLVESFKSATNWSTYADQIKAISEMGASA